MVQAKCTYQFIVNEVDPESCPCLVQRPDLTSTVSTRSYMTTIMPTTGEPMEEYDGGESNDVLETDLNEEGGNNSTKSKEKYDGS